MAKSTSLTAKPAELKTLKHTRKGEVETIVVRVFLIHETLIILHELGARHGKWG